MASLDCHLHSFLFRGSLLNTLTGLLGPLGPLLQLRGTVTSHFVNVCECVCVWTCQIATEESVCENKGGRGRECVSGRRLSKEIYVSTTVVLDVKLSLNLGFLQHRSFLCCLVQSWLHRSLTHNASRELSSPWKPSGASMNRWQNSHSTWHDTPADLNSCFHLQQKNRKIVYFVSFVSGLAP